MADITQEGTQTGCIRVLHFVSILSRGSGVMSVIMNYYRHIDRDKVQFDFLCFLPSDDSYEAEIKDLGGHIHYVDKPGSSLGSVRQLSLFFKEHAREYTWLHNHEVYLSFLLRPISKRYGIEKFIVHCHATKYSDQPLNALRNWLLCLPVRLMKVERFACSEAAGRFLYGERKMKAGKVFVMNNAIDCEKFKFRPEIRERLRKEMGLEGKFVIGNVGRFERQKNHEFLIRVFAEVHKEMPESILLLVGEGALKRYIEDLVKKLELNNNVVFLGQRDDVAELYQVMDLFILPSLYEGMPVSCLEAQVCGVPSIISNTITKEVIINNTQTLPLNDREVWINHLLYYQKPMSDRAVNSLKSRSILSAKNRSILKAVFCLQTKYLEE